MSFWTFEILNFLLKIYIFFAIILDTRVGVSTRSFLAFHIELYSVAYLGGLGHASHKKVFAIGKNRETWLP